MRMTTIDAASLTALDIGSWQTVYNSSHSLGYSVLAVAAIRIAGRAGAADVDMSVRVTLGGRLLTVAVVPYFGTATATLEIQTQPFLWETGDVLLVEIQSSDAADDAVDTTAAIDGSAIAVDAEGKVAVPDTQKVDAYTARGRPIGDVGVGKTFHGLQSADVDATSVARRGAEDVTLSTLATRIPAALFSGISSLASWLRLLARKDAPDATAIAQLNDGGGGYDPAEHSGEAIGDAIATLTPPGGNEIVTVTVQDSIGAPIQDAVVVIRTAVALIDRQPTDPAGIADCSADDGTYTLVVTHPHFASHTATLTVPVSGVALTVVLAGHSITPSPAPNRVTGYAPVYDRQGNLQPDITVSYRMVNPPPAETEHGIFAGTVDSVVSDSQGLAVIEGMVLDARYEIWRGEPDAPKLRPVVVEVKTADLDGHGNLPLPPILGTRAND